jgi:hypothetical protein
MGKDPLRLAFGARERGGGVGAWGGVVVEREERWPSHPNRE